MKTITYAVDENGTVYSRMGSVLAIPVLLYNFIGKDGDFTKPLEFQLEKVEIKDLSTTVFFSLIWTKKIPTQIKNKHRKFWGLSPLKVK